MAGWRDNVTAEAQADLDDLVDAAVDFALERIASAGEFLPFTLAVSTDGERQALQPNYPRGQDVPVGDQLAAQWRAVADLKDSLRAAAIAVNVTLPERNRDGIEITVEHRDGVAIGMIFPYAIDADGEAELVAPMAHREEPRVWTA
jgi:hypothetical protein